MRASDGSVSIDPLDVLDLEDGVGERLGGAVVDLLGEPRSLGLLRLHDPHLDIVWTADLGDERGVAALEEQPGALERALGELQLVELGLVVAKVSGQVLDVAAEGATPGIVRSGLGRVGGAIDGGGAGHRLGVAWRDHRRRASSRISCHWPSSSA